MHQICKLRIFCDCSEHSARRPKNCRQSSSLLYTAFLRFEERHIHPSEGRPARALARLVMLSNPVWSGLGISLKMRCNGCELLQFSVQSCTCDRVQVYIMPHKHVSRLCFPLHVPFLPSYAKKPAHWSCLLQGYHKRLFHASQKSRPKSPQRSLFHLKVTPCPIQRESAPIYKAPVSMLNVGVSSRSEISSLPIYCLQTKQSCVNRVGGQIKAASLCLAVGANVMMSSDVE